MKSTMSRYMDPAVAAQLLAGGDEVLAQKRDATVLFSDIADLPRLLKSSGRSTR